MSKKGRDLVLVLLVIGIIHGLTAITSFFPEYESLDGFFISQLNFSIYVIVIVSSISVPVILLLELRHNITLKYLAIIMLVFYLTRFSIFGIFGVSPVLNNTISILNSIALLGLLIYSIRENGFKLIEIYITLLLIIRIYYIPVVYNAYFMYLYTNFAFGSRTEFWITIIPTVIGFIIPILTLVVVYVECKKEEKNESWTYIKYKKSYKGLESYEIR